MGERLRGLGGRPRVTLKAPNQILRLVGRGGLGVRRIGAIILSRKSRLLIPRRTRAIRGVIGSALGRHRILLFSTALPPIIRRLTGRLATSTRIVHIRGSRAVRTTNISRVCFITRTESGVGVLRGVSELRSVGTLMFIGSVNGLAIVTRGLSFGGVSSDALRDSLDGFSERGTVGGFHANGAGVLVTASITTEKLSVGKIARIIRFSFPGSVGRCIRHSKEAKEFNTDKAIVSLIARERRHRLGGVTGRLNRATRGGMVQNNRVMWESGDRTPVSINT